MEPTYTEEELENLKAENHKFTYEGKEYDQYQASQVQRRIERTIRKLKREKIAQESAGLADEAQATTIRMRRLMQKYTEFSTAAGLPEQRDRMKVEYV